MHPEENGRRVNCQRRPAEASIRTFVCARWVLGKLHVDDRIYKSTVAFEDTYKIEGGSYEVLPMGRS